MLPVKEVIYDLFIMQYIYSPNTACISWKNMGFFQMHFGNFQPVNVKK